MEINMAKLFYETPEDRLIDFFLQRDSIRNLDNEIAFTINPKYKCTINCDICFVKNWITHEDFLEKFSNLTYSNEWKNMLFKSFQYFNEITTFDDLLYLKKFMSNQYSFYKENAQLFSVASFTDNGVFLLSDIILSELNFKEIYEMSFSSSFIVEKYKDIIIEITKILEKYDIRYIKIIKQKGMTKNELCIYKKFLNFIKKQNIKTVVMKDIFTGWDENSENRCAVYSEKDSFFQLLNGPLYLAYDKFYIDFKDHVYGTSPFEVSTLSNFCNNMTSVIPALLDVKIAKYREQAKKIKDKNTRFFKYFSIIEQSLKVNYDYNFIPFILLRDHSKWLIDFVKKDWELTEIGLIHKDVYNGAEPISVIERV